MTALPTAACSGLDANVLKYPVRDLNIKQLAVGRCRRQWQTIAHGFAHRHDVRHKVHYLVSPPGAGATETCLNLVCDKNAAASRVIAAARDM